MRLTQTGQPPPAVLHVHPSRHCNLACRHCYSSSGPRERAALPTSVIEQAIRDAAALGYSVVSFSGGEPFLYAGLESLLEVAKSCGLSTSVVTNGYLVGRAPDLRAARNIDQLVLSIDGPPSRHNFMRGAADAFSTLERALGVLRDSGRAFGLIHTVTRQTWNEIEWLVEFAETMGASQLQLHPLEDAGRATGNFEDARLTAADLARLYVLGGVMTPASPSGMQVHVDCTHVDLIAGSPDLFFVDNEGPPREAGRHLLSPLIIEEDGTLVPYVYGLDCVFAVGSLREGSLPAALERFEQSGAQDRVRKLCEATLGRALDNRESAPVINWYEALLAEGEHEARRAAGIRRRRG